MSLIAMGFGDPALKHDDSLVAIADILHQCQQAGSPVIAVVGALPGVNDLLRESIELGSYNRVYNKLVSIHSSIARKLIPHEHDRAMLIHDIEDILGAYNWLGRSMINRKPTPAETATILAIGERLSARLLAGHLQNRGVHVSAINGHELIISDDEFLAATPDLELSRQRCETRLKPLLDEGYVVVTGAATGGTPDARPTRLAGDSGYNSSSLLALINRASSMWLMHDQDGVLTIAPEYAASARTIPVLPAGLLTELAAYGFNLPSAAVLAPVIEGNIPIFVRGIFHAGNPGTYIQPNGSSELDGMCPIIVQKRIGLMHVEGIDAVEGLAILHNEPMAAAASADGKTFFVDQANLNIAHLVLSRAFPGQRLRPQRDNYALVTMIGLDDIGRELVMHHTRNLLAAEAISPVEVILTGSGDSRTNVSVLLPNESIEVAVEKIHTLILQQSK